MILLDVSRSMDAEDILPSRLKKAKHSISYLLDELNGDRVGVVVFAGSSILLSPLTSDYEIIRSYLQNADSSIFSNQGTNFENALSLAEKALKRGGANVGSEEIPQTIIVMSDGEETRGQLEQAAKNLKEKGFKIFSIGFGTEKGVPIPLRDNQGELTGYKKDNRGETVISKLQVAALKTMADAGGGNFYYDSLDKSEIKSILNSIKKMERTDKKSIQAKIYTEYFWYPLVFGIIFLLFSTVGNMRSLFKTSLHIFLFFFIPLSAHSAWWHDSAYNSQEKALSSIKDQDSAKAAEATLTELQASDPSSPELAYNLSNLQMQNNPKEVKAPAVNLEGDLLSAHQFNLAGRAAKAGEKSQALKLYAELIQNLSKKKTSKTESAILEQTKKNLELLTRPNNQDQKQDQKNQPSSSGDSQNQKSQDGEKNKQDSKGDESNKDKQDAKDQKNKSNESDNKNDKESDSDKDKKENEKSDSSNDQNNNEQQNSSYQQPRRKKFMDRQDLSESDAKRILDSLKAQEGKLQKDFIKKQEKGKKFDYDESPEKDW
jgi:Ca-activated chloride channel family protein